VRGRLFLSVLVKVRELGDEQQQQQQQQQQ